MEYLPVTGAARYALLLRGVNVGGRRKLAMTDLRDQLTRLGYTDVTTLLQSGNAAFTGPASDPALVGPAIEAALRVSLGVATACVVRDAAQMAGVLEGNPLRDLVSDGSRAMVHFLAAVPDPALVAAHDPAVLAPAHVAAGPGVVYQWCPDGLLAAPLVGPFLEKRWRVLVTSRNWNTVTKLAALLGVPGEAGRGGG